MSRRVLFIIGSGSVGGRECQLLRLGTELVSAGWQPGVVFMSSGGPVADALRSAGIPVWLPVLGSAASSPRRPLTYASHVVATIRLLRRAARTHKPAVIHAMLPASVQFGLTAISGVRLLHRPRTRRIAGIYGFTPTMHPVVARMYRRQLRRADAVVCNAPHLSTEMVHLGLSQARVHVIANGVELPADVADVQKEPPVAVMVANFHSYKGYGDLLRALALVPAGIDVKVRLCGTGAERDAMQTLAAQLNVADRVVFVEPPADVAAELAAAQFAIHPSHTEGLSNAILEQLAVGLPVIACRVGGNPELVADGHNGLLIPPADPVVLAAAISSLATDSHRRVQMAAAARSTAERFSWSACWQAHIELYRKIITGIQFKSGTP